MKLYKLTQGRREGYVVAENEQEASAKMSEVDGMLDYLEVSVEEVAVHGHIITLKEDKDGNGVADKSRRSKTKVE